MNNMFMETSVSVYHYFWQAIASVKPIWVWLLSILSYVLFPTESYVPATIAVGVACVIDVLTKYYAIAMTNGGFRAAFKNGKISSNSLWEGSLKKLLGYFIILIMSGLSYRVAFLTSVSVFISTICMSILFLRETTSVLENLRDAGHSEVEWLIFWLKRKQKQVLDTDNIINPIEENFQQQSQISFPTNNPPIVEENNAGFPIVPQDQNRPTI